MKITIAVVALLSAGAQAIALNTASQLSAQTDAEFGFGGFANKIKSRVDDAKDRVKEAKEKAETLKEQLDIDGLQDQIKAGNLPRIPNEQIQAAFGGDLQQRIKMATDAYSAVDQAKDQGDLSKLLQGAASQEDMLGKLG